MADLAYFLVAESAVVDQTTNRVSVFHLVEEVAFPAFPGHIPQLVAVTCWKCPDREQGPRIPLRLQVRFPDGLPSPPYEMTLEPSEVLWRRAFFTLSDILFPQPGEYVFELFDGEQMRGSWTVTAFASSEPA
ncbi:MAG: DUF6941 family protein [Gemmataceae bacterium]